MPTIAPWEDPDLPAPFATVEREIEGRPRQFALWRWDDRIVWRDLRFRQLWWATLDVAASLAEWERAIEAGKFGRAFTSECKKTLNGSRINLPSSCNLFVSRAFYVVVASDGAGFAREKAENFWLPFTPQDDHYTRHKRERAPSVWHPNRKFFGIKRELMRAFAPVFIERVSPGLRAFIVSGTESTALKAMRDLMAWNVARKILFDDFVRKHRTIYQKIIAGFGLPEESRFGVFGERKQLNGVQLQFGIGGEYQRWEIQSSVSLATTAHELLELQLRLRDSLKPILTSAEIEEILMPPARL